jgi:hypothetical protein
MLRRLLLCLVVASCTAADEPQGSLIEEADRKIADAPRALRPGEPTTRPPAPRVPYKKRDGLHIDIPFLAGRRLADLEGEILLDQVGQEVEREDEAGRTHITFERAELWVEDGKIYRVQKLLAHPMDVPTALGTSGFPLDLGQPISGVNEVRWNHAWNMRRVRLLRTAADPARYDTIDVWKTIPRPGG